MGEGGPTSISQGQSWTLKHRKMVGAQAWGSWEQPGAGLGESLGRGGMCVRAGRVSPGQAPGESLLTRRPGAVGAQAGLAAGS